MGLKRSSEHRGNVQSTASKLTIPHTSADDTYNWQSQVEENNVMLTSNWQQWMFGHCPLPSVFPREKYSHPYVVSGMKLPVTVTHYSGCLMHVPFFPQYVKHTQRCKHSNNLEHRHTGHTQHSSQNSLHKQNCDEICQPWLRVLWFLKTNSHHTGFVLQVHMLHTFILVYDRECNIHPSLMFLYIKKILLPLHIYRYNIIWSKAMKAASHTQGYQRPMYAKYSFNAPWQSSLNIFNTRTTFSFCQCWHNHWQSTTADKFHFREW